MKTMNISPLSLVILLSFIWQQELRPAESDTDSDPKMSAYPSLDFLQTSYRTTGPISIPHPTHHHQSAPGSYPPSYSDEKRELERTPSSGCYSDSGFSPFAQFTPSPGYAYQPHPGYAHQPYPVWAQPAPAGHLASLPVAEAPTEKRGHTRQRSNTFNLGDLSLEADSSSTDGVKEMPVPRQLQDAVGSFAKERDLLLAAARHFLKKAKEEGKTTIEGFNTMVNNTGDASPRDTRRDSTIEKLTKKFQSKDKKAEESLAQKRKNLLEMAEPYNTRFDTLAAQCTLMAKAFEEATKKLTPDGAQQK